MIATTLSWVASQINGVLHGQDCSINAVSTDTRTIEEGAIYLALKGLTLTAINLSKRLKMQALWLLLRAKT